MSFPAYRIARTAAVLAIFLFTGGCWSREQPLVTPAEAVQPVPSGNYGEFAVTKMPDKSYRVISSKPADDEQPLTCLTKPLEKTFHILQCGGAEKDGYVILLARVMGGETVTLYGAGDDGYRAWIEESHPDLDAPALGEMVKIQSLTGSLADDTALLAGYAGHLAAAPPPADQTVTRSDE